MRITFLRNISIKRKFLFIVLLPLISLAGLASLKVYELHQKTTELTSLVRLMDVSVSASNLVHELQKERGASAGFIGSRGTNFADVLPKQRQNTNGKIESLKAVLGRVDTSEFGEKYTAALKKALSDLNKIENVRKQVNALEISVPQAVSYYTNLNAELLGVTERAIWVARDPAIIREASAYLNFLQSKERAGIERAVGAAGFSGGWTPELLSKFANLIMIQNTYADVFKVYATEEELDYYNKAIKDPSFAKVQEMRDAVFASAMNPDVNTNITATEWFATITKKINVLKKIEDHLSKDVHHVAEVDAQNAAAERNFYIISQGILITFILMLTVVILRDLLSSIKNTQDVMGVLATGDTNVEIIGIDRRDEIGGMAKSIEVFKQGLIEKKEMEEAALRAQARAEEEKRQAMIDLADSFDSRVGGLIDSLASASTQLQSTAEGMNGIAEQTSQASQTVAASTEEASTNVSTVASAMEEMSASSNEIATQVSGARIKSNDTADNAQMANKTVSDLSVLVDNIGEVVTAIQDIAEQTNLLALNATIEAARAGEAGKGFAVVADEVKKLATETGNKTGEINQRITEIQEATRASVTAMERIIMNISEIDESVTGVSAAVEEQNATTSEIVRSISEASQGVQEVAQIIVDVQKGSQETGTSAGAVLDASTEVARLSESLKLSVEEFLAQIKGE